MKILVNLYHRALCVNESLSLLSYKIKNNSFVIA